MLGLMPHPERAAEAAMGGTDGLLIFHSLLGSLVEDGTFSKRRHGASLSSPHPQDRLNRHAASLRRVGRLGKRAEHMIELVARARRLGREIAPVVGVDRAVQRHPQGDIDAGAESPSSLLGLLVIRRTRVQPSICNIRDGDAVVA